MDYNSYGTYGTDATTSILAGLGIFLVIFLIVCLPIVIICIIGRWKMYKKAGKNGWEAIVPFYSDWVYTQIAGVEWWWFLALIFSSLFTIATSKGESISVNVGYIVPLIGSFVCNYNISKKLHKDTGFAVLMTIFPIIFIPVIGFSSNYTFDESVPVTKNGPFDANKANNQETNTNVNNNQTTDNSTKNEQASEKKDDTASDGQKKSSEFCPNCGSKLDGNSKFCGNCGKEI